MARRPPDRNPNRFAILGDYIEQPYVNNYPALQQPKSNILSDPKYLIVSSENNQLRKLSPFIIHKGLHAISTLIDSISQLRDGNLLLLVRNQVIADKFLKAKTLSNICPITVKLHETLNYVKGVIYAPCLIDVSEEEIVKELQPQGVVAVYKYTISKKDNTNDNANITEDEKNKSNKVEHSGYMVLTFNLYNLPKVIDVAWYKVKVKTYFPNPMRCQKCQLLGHTKNKCNNPESCVICNLPPHTSTECTRIQCANCNDNHPASDRNCPRYIQQKEIIRIKTLEKCSFGAAKRKYEISNTAKSQQKEKQSYSEITKDNSSKNQPKQIQKRLASPSSGRNENKKQTRRESSTSSTFSDIVIDLPPGSSQDTGNINHTNKQKDKQINQQQTTNQNEATNLQLLTKQIQNTTSNETTDHLIKKQKKSKKSKKDRTKIDQATSIENDDKFIISSSEQTPSTSISPLGRLTQDLISEDQYYLPASAMDASSDS